MKRLVVIALLFVLGLSGVSAQGEDVALRFYIVPITQVGVYRSPSHFGGRAVAPDAELVGVAWSMMDYGLINVGLVAANVNGTQQTYLAGLTDIQPVPANIDNTVAANQVNAIQNKLEAFDIPGTWVNTGDSYRVILREIIGYFLFMQKLTAITGIDPTTLNIRLSVRYNQMPQLWQDALRQAFSEMKYSTANLTGTSTLRAILRDVAAQNGAREFQIGGVTL